MKPVRTWILVADGKRGRIYKRERADSSLEAALDRDFRHQVHRASELGADRPGKVRESANAAHHGITPKVDWTRQEKQQFAELLANVLEWHASEKAFDRLILVAPPQTLGDLRASLGSHARERLMGELGKDLTALPRKELQARLSDAGLLV